MAEINSPSVEERAAVHRALGDEHRLRLIDALVGCDRTPGELGSLTGMSSNLLAFHLRNLEGAGIVERRRSEGDSRRRYVHLRAERFALGIPNQSAPVATVMFVCNHNSASSQFAEALWRRTVGGEVWSAGLEPADQVHPYAAEAGREHDLDLVGMEPKGYEAVPTTVDLIISVCDRAFEAGLPMRGDKMHWSIPDPVGGGPDNFAFAFDDIAERIGRLRDRVT
ncbi:MAG: helix-turn-helix domain-containing protein [Acidimicrobiia bacterium]|nr:helix-turn-helix domain-containing protein [Acidimicrobiia bacterium]